MDRQKVLQLFHAIWVEWMRDLLRGCKINPDGTRTIPTSKLKNYIDNIMMPAELLDYELTKKNKAQIDELIKLLEDYVRGELDE